MTTTSHDSEFCAPFAGSGEPWRGAAPAGLPAPRHPEQPYLTFPTARQPQPGPVLATRVVGLVVTALCALWPAFFALMFIAFGLGLGDVGAVVMGGVVAVFALGWPLAVWFATTRARHVWPVLLTLVPTFLTIVFSAYVFLV
jgi:hypothetical protein